MIVSDSAQARVFLIYVLVGIGCIMLSDCFFVLRKYFGKGKWHTNLIDAIYFLLAFLLVLYAGVRFNLGAFRYYQLMGLLMGMAIQKLMLSAVCRTVFDVMFVFTVRCTACVAGFLWKGAAFVLGLFFQTTDFVENKTLHFCKKVKKRATKVKLKKQKGQKTVKKRLKMI